MSQERSYQDELNVVREPKEPEYAFIPARNKSELFHSVYHRLYLPVYHFARRFVGPEDAEEIASESFYKLWKSQVDYSILPRAKTWLQVCARNACLDLIKSKKINTRNQLELLHIQDIITETESEVQVREDLLHKLHLEIEKLPRRSRQVFKMAYLDGQSSKDIASVLGISENTVSNHRVSAMKALRLHFRNQIWILLLISGIISDIFTHLL